MNNNLTIEEMRSGYCVLWCYSCKDSKVHKKVKQSKGKWGIMKITLYECVSCGRRTKR